MDRSTAESIMNERGYSVQYYTNQDDVLYMIKHVGELSDEDSFPIFAIVYLDRLAVELHSNPFKFFISLKSESFSFTHKDFDKYEQKMCEYINSLKTTELCNEIAEIRKEEMRKKREENNRNTDSGYFGC
jgi:hypothetical protein